jgi:hypothetical protein
MQVRAVRGDSGGMALWLISYLKSLAERGELELL